MLIASFPDIDNCVKMLAKVLNVANVLHKRNNFSDSGFFVSIQAYSSISRLKQTNALLPESSQKTLESSTNPLTSKQKTTRPIGGIWTV